MNTADSLASGALGVALTALAWLIAHTAQIRKVLDLLPAVAADAAKAKTAVETGGIGHAVTHVTAELDNEAKALLSRILTMLEAQTPPAAPASDVTVPTTPAAGQPTA